MRTNGTRPLLEVHNLHALEAVGAVVDAGGLAQLLEALHLFTVARVGHETVALG